MPVRVFNEAPDTCNVQYPSLGRVGVRDLQPRIPQTYSQALFHTLFTRVCPSAIGPIPRYPSVPQNGLETEKGNTPVTVFPVD